jgi:hypothetical protein
MVVKNSFNAALIFLRFMTNTVFFITFQTQYILDFFSASGTLGFA